MEIHEIQIEASKKIILLTYLTSKHQSDFDNDESLWGLFENMTYQNIYIMVSWPYIKEKGNDDAWIARNFNEFN